MPETNKSSKRISPRKVSNLKVVVLCIAAATTFWILNALNKDDYTTVVDFPVEISFDQDQYIAVSALPKTLEIEISGDGWDLLRKYFNFNSDAFPIELNNPAAKNFILTSDLKRSLGEFLSPTQLVSVLDDSLKFQVDRIKTLKVKPVLDSAGFTMAKNFRIMGQIAFSPETITLKGPGSMLDSLSRTFPITLNENRLNKSVDKLIELEVPDSMGELVQIDEEQINVKFEVVEFLEGNKRLKINKTHFPPNVALADEDVVIMISYLVDERKVGALKDIEFEAVVDYYKRNKEDSTISVQVRPQPDYLDQIVISPAILRLKYE
ncbi:YbbR-like domain-containing protein [Algoriphagus sp. AGSA1]|uniref:YbbR-like domain-containing protein n=1 Tax=Algoriphagus sp. AGSA1 TaxID=2907213 RepID=UPI001F45941D|nr:YbbR-like domain-containing protein [Algoriphagus sp. AGSA1]MCE7056645.1 YbbR-like domain-containing protein [Algoriphagus sp. AGSA1]